MINIDIQTRIHYPVTRVLTYLNSLSQLMLDFFSLSLFILFFLSLSSSSSHFDTLFVADPF